jgi:hypothetical protein
MQTRLNTPIFLAEAASVASAMPRRHDSDEECQSGDVFALAGRHAR